MTTMSFLQAETAATLVLDDGREISLRFRVRPNARRITLSIDVEAGALNVTLPRRASRTAALDFARSKSGWILHRLSTLPPRRPFEDGAVVPILGIDHVIRHCPEMKGRGMLERVEGELRVAGDAQFLRRRVTEWLKREAKRECGERAHIKAASIDKRIGDISLRDTTSRWGSCGPDGRLMFCWRLIMAPDYVLDYVVAHEVAHLAFASHGPRFWALATRLTQDAPSARRWLRREGARLFRFG